MAASASSSSSGSGSAGGLKTTLHYNRLTEKKLRAYEPPAPPGAETVESIVPFTATIQDARATSSPPTLLTHGFELLRLPATLKTEEYYDDRKVREIHYARATAAITALTGARRVQCFHHAVRSSEPGSGKGPAGVVHCDYSYRNAMGLMHAMGKAGEFSGRFMVVNVWTPIADPVMDHHLACCDARSVCLPDDLILQDFVAKGNTSETYRLDVGRAHRHRWYYYPGMTRDELLVFMQYDSDPDSLARFCPHSSVRDPGCPAGYPPRKSIETRTVVFIPDADPAHNTMPKRIYLGNDFEQTLTRTILTALGHAVHWPQPGKRWAQGLAKRSAKNDASAHAAVSELIMGLLTAWNKKGEHGMHNVSDATKHKILVHALTHSKEDIRKALVANFGKT